MAIWFTISRTTETISQLTFAIKLYIVNYKRFIPKSRIDHAHLQLKFEFCTKRRRNNLHSQYFIIRINLTSAVRLNLYTANIHFNGVRCALVRRFFPYAQTPVHHLLPSNFKISHYSHASVQPASQRPSNLTISANHVTDATEAPSANAFRQTFQSRNWITKRCDTYPISDKHSRVIDVSKLTLLMGQVWQLRIQATRKQTRVCRSIIFFVRKIIL